jgi:hypothetical protein
MIDTERIELRLEDIIEEVKEINRKVDELRKLLGLMAQDDYVGKLAEQEAKEEKND